MGYNEEELLYLSKQGCPIATEYLLRWCKEYVEKVMRNVSVYNQSIYDFHDLIQCAWITCIQALDRYRSDKKCRLKTYLTTVIRNQVSSLLRKVCLEKERFHDHSISLDEQNKSGYFYNEVISDSRNQYNPRTYLYVSETKMNYENIINTQCSPLEKEVIALKAKGKTHKEIAQSLNVEIKVVYNALYRIQKKLT